LAKIRAKIYRHIKERTTYKRENSGGVMRKQRYGVEDQEGKNVNWEDMRSKRQPGNTGCGQYECCQ